MKMIFKKIMEIFKKIKKSDILFYFLIYGSIILGCVAFIKVINIPILFWLYLVMEIAALVVLIFLVGVLVYTIAVLDRKQQKK